MTMAYDRYPGIDENDLFPPAVREALAKGTTLVLNQDLNTVTDSGVHRAEFGSIAASIKNRPVDFVQPFMVSVRWISESNGILIQEAWMKISGKYRSRQLYRVKLGSNWGEWIDLDFHRPQKDLPNTLAVIGTSESEGPDAWVEKMRPLTSSEITNFARSGDDSNVVAIRSGAMTVSGLVANNTIPASGSVVFTSKEKLQLRENRIIGTGTIAGILGTLTHTTNNSFTFSRDTSGTAKSVTGTQEFISSFTTDASTVVVIAGGNDFNQGVKASDGTTKTQVLGNYYRIVEHFESLGKTVLVCGVTTRASTPPGSTGFNEIMEINKSLYSRYPDHYIDRQGYLSQKAIYDANLTPTPTDLTAISLGDIPPQLRLADGVHETPLAQNTVATRLMLPWLSASGAITPNSTPMSLPVLSPNFYQWDAKISTVEGLQSALNAKASAQPYLQEISSGTDILELPDGNYIQPYSVRIDEAGNYPPTKDAGWFEIRSSANGTLRWATYRTFGNNGVLWINRHYGAAKWFGWILETDPRKFAEISYDSGRRDITSLAGDRVTGGKIYLHRVANQVFLDIELLEPSSTMTTGVSFLEIPPGFRRQTRLDRYVPYGITAGSLSYRSMFIFNTGGLGVWTPQTTDRYRLNLTWITKDAIPATPPGAPS